MSKHNHNLAYKKPDFQDDLDTPLNNLVFLDDFKKPGLKGKPEILLVEDDQTFMSMLQKVFRDYPVICADNGQIALDLFKQRNPDLVITDLIMPQMTGFELIQRLSAYNNVPIIAMSGYELDYKDYKNQIIKEHTVEFLQKPFALDTLEEMVKKVVF